MHLAALHLVPILGAEKSKVAFYVAGGLLALWAITLSVGIGLRTPDFPGNARGQRAIIAVSAVLMVAAMSTAVITSGGAARANAARAGAPPAGGVASTLSEAADPAGALKFVKSKLTVPAGRVTIDFANMSQIPHNMTIAQGSTVLGATPTFTGATKSVTLNLKPGKYVFYCSVPGHRQAGMQGTLTVSP
jgi:plastocyanin